MTSTEWYKKLEAEEKAKEEKHLALVKEEFNKRVAWWENHFNEKLDENQIGMYSYFFHSGFDRAEELYKPEEDF